MAFKPYCDQCSTWHTEAEGHRCPRCGARSGDDWSQCGEGPCPMGGPVREACHYCGPGKYTGLPGNACENCMNTGYANPTAEDLK